MNSMLYSIMCNPWARPGRSAAPFEELLREGEWESLSRVDAGGRTDGWACSTQRDETFFPSSSAAAVAARAQKLVRSFAIADFLLAASLPLLSLSLPLVFLFFHSWRGKRERERNAQIQSKEAERGRKGEHASLAPSKPPSAIFPPSPFHPESLSQEREREREGDGGGGHGSV